MPPKNTAILIITFSIIISLSILGVFDIPVSKNTLPAPAASPVVKSAPVRTTLPKFTLSPIKIPERTPLTLRLSPKTTPAQISQSTKNPISPSIFEGFESSSFEQLFTALDLFSGTPFGGKVLYTIDCNPLFCGGPSRLIGVGPPKGGIFAETGATKIYREYAISVGNWVLGLAGSPEICWNFVCSFEGCACIPTGAGSEIEMIGTSK